MLITTLSDLGCELVPLIGDNQSVKLQPYIVSPRLLSFTRFGGFLFVAPSRLLVIPSSARSVRRGRGGRRADLRRGSRLTLRHRRLVDALPARIAADGERERLRRHRARRGRELLWGLINAITCLAI